MSSFIAVGSSSIASEVIQQETCNRRVLDLTTLKESFHCTMKATRGRIAPRKHFVRKSSETPIPFRASSPRDESVRWRTLGVRTRPRVALERLAEELSARG